VRLRPRQGRAVQASVDALEKHSNTLLIAPTGAGKTIMLSAVAGHRINNAPTNAPNKGLILQHRDELVDQNAKKFRRVNPHISISLFNAGSKSWAGRAVFAMVQTLARNLKTIPEVDMVTVDEGHHATAPSYRGIFEAVLAKNPNAKIFGVTATPNRGDGTPMRDIFDNVADQISIGELIATGHLVRPRTFVLDVGVTTQLQSVRRLATDFDMAQVAQIMDREIITDQIVHLWAHGDEARGLPACRKRPTVVFCSTVAHAEHVAEAFRQAKVRAECIHGSLTSTERARLLAEYGRGQIDVLVNVAVLTEGWDHPPTSCVILLRPSSYKSTMVQMIGRGLRTIDPAEYPGVIKTDCVVLDFGTSSLTHGSLEEDANLDGEPHDGEAPMKECPACEASVPISTMECPLCGHQWERGSKEKAILGQVVLTEIDLLAKSNFKWVDIWGDDNALMASGFDAWSGMFYWKGLWHAVGGTRDTLKHLGVGERLVALALGDDFLNDHEDTNSSHKAKRWLREPATEKQLKVLGIPAFDTSVTKYQAGCMLTFRMNKRAIMNMVTDADQMREAA
jgi:DNA repair protein RadD